MKRSCEEVLEDGSSCNATVEETDNFCRTCGERVDKKKFKPSFDKVVVQAGTDSSTKTNQSVLLGSDGATQIIGKDNASDDATRSNNVDVGSDDATRKDCHEFGSDDATVKDDIEIGSDAANEDATSKNQFGSASHLASRNYYEEYRTCWNCEEDGHISRDCPEMECGWCDDYDHKAHQCPERRARRKKSYKF